MMSFMCRRSSGPSSVFGQDGHVAQVAEIQIGPTAIFLNSELSVADGYDPPDLDPREDLVEART